MKVKFRKFATVREVITRLENDPEAATAMSKSLVSWDVTNPVTGEKLPLPEPDTSDWYMDVSWADWVELNKLYAEWRFADLPKQNVSPS